MLPIHTVLCPLDFSEPSYKALQVAIEMAAYFKADIVLVHIVAAVRPSIQVDPALAFAGTEEYEETAKKAAEEQLTIAAQHIPAGLKWRTAIATGDTADEIVRLAKTQAADMIVIATHGLTGWRHLVFGSVAEKVIRLSEQPVLVIPAHSKARSRAESLHSGQEIHRSIEAVTAPC